MNAIAFVLVLSVSCYAPASGDGVSGGMQTASGAPVANWIAACPNWLAIGTVIELPVVGGGGPRHPDRVTARVVCGDSFHPRFAGGHNLDLAIAPAGAETEAERRRRWRDCIAFGRQSMRVTATPPPANWRWRWGPNALTDFEATATRTVPTRAGRRWYIRDAL